MIIQSCPKCGFSILIQQIDFDTMAYYFYCLKCGYVELNF